MLHIKGISKKFGTKQVLDNVTLQVKKGDIAFLLGSSGVGKSTLLRVLNNLESADTGTVTLNGTVLDLSTVNKSHTIGIVFQHFNLFENLTAHQNITLALIQVAKQGDQKATALANQLLARYDLLEHAHAYPANLSGGQKQRLAIARTIALEPDVLCLDEPTSALDPLLTNSVAQTINDLAAQGYIIIIASHDVSLLKKLNCTVYLMKHGSIIEQTTSKEFLANSGNYPYINRFVSGE